MAIEDPLWPRADQWLRSRVADPEVLVVGVPSSSASLSPSRAYLTPPRLRRQLERFSTYHGGWGIDLSRVVIADHGDMEVEDLDMHVMPTAVEHAARQLPDVPITLYIGGDNAITRPLVNALASDDLDATAVLTFDAHHDVRTLDQGPTNGTPIRGLIEDGLPAGHVIQVGIHSFANSRQYREYCDEKGIGVVTIDEVEERGVVPAVTESIEILAARADRIHVDVDLDVLDRAFAPACPGARPGGMTVRQLASGVRVAAAHPAVRSVDFVEVNAEQDRDDLTMDALATVFLGTVAGYAERESP